MASLNDRMNNLGTRQWKFFWYHFLGRQESTGEQTERRCFLLLSYFCFWLRSSLRVFSDCWAGCWENGKSVRKKAVLQELISNRFSSYSFLKRCYSMFGETMDLLALINAAIGFLLYGAMSKQFRVTFKSLFFRQKSVHSTNCTRVTNTNNTNVWLRLEFLRNLFTTKQDGL